MANLLIWWRQRTPSEQRLLLGLTGLLAACAFWYGLWQPWRAREAQWRQTLVKEQASLRWMTEHPSALRFPGADRLAGRSGDARRQRDLAVRDRAAVATRLGHGQPSAAGARR